MQKLGGDLDNLDGSDGIVKLKKSILLLANVSFCVVSLAAIYSHYVDSEAFYFLLPSVCLLGSAIYKLKRIVK